MPVKEAPACRLPLRLGNPCRTGGGLPATPRDRRRSRSRCPKGTRSRHLCEWAMTRPKLISPLSIRRLNPHSGLLHAQALYVIGAPSRP